MEYVYMILAVLNFIWAYRVASGKSVMSKGSQVLSYILIGILFMQEVQKF